MNNNNKMLVLSALISFSIAAPAMAKLYVSPVVRNTVKIDTTPQSDISKAEQIVSGSMNDAGLSAVSGESTVHGPFLMKDSSDSASTLMRYGRNVPLFVALEKVVPDSDSWFIHLDDGLEGSVVSWDGGDSWEDVLRLIEEQNGMHIVINTEEKAIGVSSNGKLATSLAKQIPQVWKLEPGKSLRENLIVWSGRAGWSLQWDPSLNFDYPVDHGAVLTGQFTGEGGVVDQVLYSFRNAPKPLTAVFYEANNVVLITNAGFKQEVAY